MQHKSLTMCKRYAKFLFWLLVIPVVLLKFTMMWITPNIVAWMGVEPSLVGIVSYVFLIWLSFPCVYQCCINEEYEIEPYYLTSFRIFLVAACLFFATSCSSGVEHGDYRDRFNGSLEDACGRPEHWMGDDGEHNEHGMTYYSECERTYYSTNGGR